MKPSRLVSRQEVISHLRNLLETLAAQVEGGIPPQVKIRCRTKGNIHFNKAYKYWELGSKTTRKTSSTSGGSKELLRLINMVSFILEQLEEGGTTTCRELYYYSQNWLYQCRFDEMNQSNMVLQNLEILTNYLREQLGIVPQISGSIFGPLVVETRTRAGIKEVNCNRDVSQAGFPIPPRVEDWRIKDCKANFVLIIQTGGMYQRLVQNKFDQEYNCILIHTHGQASRATRLAVNRIVTEYGIPGFVFSDGDVWGTNLSYNIISGSIKSVHLSDRLCTPSVIHLGLTSPQIQEYGLPTEPITARQAARIEEMLQDPRYCTSPTIVAELEHMKKFRVKAEQQALAIRGLNYVTDQFLPRELAKYGLYRTKDTHK